MLPRIRAVQLLSGAYDRHVSAAHLRTGADGENLAVVFLENLGLSIVARNFRCRLGEIDIVARSDRLLHIVEVKTRRRPLHEPREVVRPDKQRQLVRVARCFISVHRAEHWACQFDVIVVHGEPGARPRIDYYEDAFQAQ